MTVTKSRLNEEVSDHQKGFRFETWLKGSQYHWSSQISGLQSGSREIYSPTKFWSAQIRFNNVRFKKELTSRKFEFKGRQKISGWKWRFRFKIRFKGKMSPTALKLSISGSRSRFKKNLPLAKKLKITEEDLLPWCAVQTWVSGLIGLTYYLSHGGSRFVKRGIYSLYHAWLHGVDSL